METAEVSFTELALNKDIFKNFENSLPLSKSSASQIYYDLRSLEQKLGSNIKITTLQTFKDIPEWLEEIKDSESSTYKTIN